MPRLLKLNLEAIVHLGLASCLVNFAQPELIPRQGMVRWGAKAKNRKTTGPRFLHCLGNTFTVYILFSTNLKKNRFYGFPMVSKGLSCGFAAVFKNAKRFCKPQTSYIASKVLQDFLLQNIDKSSSLIYCI
jgi:hypothetical protein